MGLGRLILRSLLFHWRGNLAVLLGVALGTSVLTGALLVGDSLRGSLRDRTLEQLGWVDHALVANRFLREELAGEMDADDACPALLLQGAASRASGGAGRRVGNVTLLGVDGRFWPRGDAPAGADFWRGGASAAEVVLNRSLAEALDAGPGDRVVFHLQKVRPVAADWLLGQNNLDREVGDATSTEKVLEELTCTVRAVEPDSGPGMRFSLNPALGSPRNAFLPLHGLQAHLRRQEDRTSSVPDKPINVILARGGTAGEWQRRLARHMRLQDWGLVLLDPWSRAEAMEPDDDGLIRPSHWRGRVPPSLVGPKKNRPLKRDEVVEFYRRRGYLSLESPKQLLDPLVTAAALEAAKEAKLEAAPTLVYFANNISAGGKEVPYSFVAALDPTRSPPLGPFLPPALDGLQDDEIILVDWVLDEYGLDLRPGDPVTLTYYHPENHGTAPPQEATFRYRGSIPIRGPADDPDLTPQFPGITDAQSLIMAKLPPPFEIKEVEKKVPRGSPGDLFWREHRATPKAYVTLAAGQRLWGSRLGNLTSIRLAPMPGPDGRRPALVPAHPPDGEHPTHAAAAEDFLRQLRPEKAGMTFEPVKEQRLQAGAGGTDFGGLFLGFSAFLIAAALILVGLLFRLNLERRASEVGLLLATGYSQAVVRRLLLAEGLVIAVAGGLLGTLAARAYAGLLLDLLRAWWPGGLDRSFLRPHATWQSLATGFGAAVAVSVLVIFLAVRGLGRVPARALLAGTVTSETEPAGAPKAPRASVWVCAVAALVALAVGVTGWLVQDHELKAMTFFGSGALLLTAGLAAVWAWLRRPRHGLVAGQGLPALARLAVRNAARHPGRSLLTAGLLASAAFVVLAVQSFRRDPGHDLRDRHSGTGGFALLGESDVLIYQDLNDPAERKRLHFPAGSDELLEGVAFYPFRLQAGDDASCLNLFQPRRPRLLGVPESFVGQGRFAFAESESDSPEEKANPWLLLKKPCPDDAVPAVGDANTVRWILGKKLGETVEMTGADGKAVKLRIVGLLQGSVFQSELLLSEEGFRRVNPNPQGYNFFLIDAPPERAAAVKGFLEKALAPRGFEAASPADRLRSYLEVENTYIATFQALGGLGLLLGAVGLAVVLLRGVWERRGELALMRALGFRNGALGWLVLAENGFLLLVGLGAGVAAAVLAVAPHLAAEQGAVPWLRLFGLLALVLAVGFGAGAAALATTLRTPLLPALRRE